MVMTFGFVGFCDIDNRCPSGITKQRIFAAIIRIDKAPKIAAEFAWKLTLRENLLTK